MKLVGGIQEYVGRKHKNGHAFEHGEANLLAFSRQVGDLDLSQLTTQQVLTYLDTKVVSAITWRLKYQILFRFFDFWSGRGSMPDLLMPPLRSLMRQTFVPYVYSRAELRKLLKATKQGPERRRILDRQTVRTFLLLLYGTGALVGEMLRLKREDVDLKGGFITIRNEGPSRSRQIPIGLDVQDVFRIYLNWRTRKQFQSVFLFVTREDQPISRRRMNTTFERLRQAANVLRHDGGTYQPRMHDLRYTFAVHRITSWIRNKADLNRMLPALAAYMGQVGLGSTERYLSMTPERFRRELDKLSPAQGNGRWRENKGLMVFLSNLQGVRTLVAPEGLGSDACIHCETSS
jgi:integrase/recombinase XerD